MQTLNRALALAILICGASLSLRAESPSKTQYKRPASLTRYDFATPDDLFLARMLGPLVSGDKPDDWSVLNGLGKQLGDWVDQFVAANRIANTINHALPVEGQPALKQIDSVVSDCAGILHVEKPSVFVRSSPLPLCYLVQAGDKNFLILTSALLHLYEGQEGELRFIVGHELGHLKCDHEKLHNAAYGVLVAIQGINMAIVPDRAQVLLPTLAFGRLCSWMRESEISADRAGLLCCQDPQVAFNALSRLLSGLHAGSTWIDPNSPNFDPNALIREYRRWEDEPFVEFVQHVKRFAAESPFIPERVAALKLWADSGEWKEILDRTSSGARSQGSQLIVFDAISVSGLTSGETTVDPYVVVFDDQHQIFTTTVVNGVRAATWREVNVPANHLDGKPYYFEVWDSNYGSDTLVAGFTIRPPKAPAKGEKTVLQAPLIWNWKERSNVTQQGYAQVRVYFKERAK